ncbi:hypothetical protein [Bradyrhizobium sp. RT3a]|uniref:hypothetical protein n=1 Tax=unclassified Bradyrhizobium TaxID=2631580 RepID=UPI0033942A7F
MSGHSPLPAALLLSNCAIHPVPEDVTGVNTYNIVRQIRCETREAAAKFVLRELKRLGSDHEDQAADPIAQSLIAQYEANPELISTFTPDLFPGPKYAQVRNFYRVIYSAAIAYNFDLTMTEQNNLGTTINLLGPWTQKFTLGLSADANRTRSNERSFTVTDTFSELLTGLNRPVRGRRYCDGQIVQANYIYPIAGHIGVDELVMTFFQLAYLGGLSADKAAPGAIGPPTIADKLTFTTTIDGSATPTALFSPAGSGFQLADASLTGMASRTDAHQVTVGLALDAGATAPLSSLRGYLFSRERSIGMPAASVAPGAAGRVLVVNTLTAQARTSAEKLAVIAIDQLKSREVQLVRAR